MNPRLIASATVTLLVGATAPAWGQQQPPAATPAGDGRAVTVAAGAAPAVDLRQLMQQSGGSLLRASAVARSQAPVASAGAAPAGFSLFGVPDPAPHVLKKHDLVNVVVREESRSATAGDSDQQRQVDFDAQLQAFIRFRAASLSVYPATGNQPEVKAQGQRDFKGTGSYNRTDTMTTRLEVEVIDVKPNGTLVLQARRHMRIDDETLDVKLTGVCRAEDVDPTNSVLSTDMHDLNLEKVTTGQVHDTTKRGLLHAILDILNPF